MSKNFKNMSKISSVIRSFVLRTNRFHIFFEVYKLIYKISLRAVIICAGKLPDVISIYLRHNRMSESRKCNRSDNQIAGEFWYGDSDVDLNVAIRPMSSKGELRFLKLFLKKWSLLLKIFPFLGEVEIFNEEEMNKFIRIGGYKGFEASKWRLVYGTNSIQKEYRMVQRKFISDAMSESFLWYCRYLPRVVFCDYKREKVFLRPLCTFLNHIIDPILIIPRISINTHNSGRSLYLQKKQDIVDLSHLLRRSGFFTNKAEDIMVTEFTRLIIFLDNVCKNVSDYLIEADVPEVDFKPLKHSAYHYEPGTLKYILKILETYAGQLYLEAKEYIESIILGSWDCCRNYEYIMYIILKDNLDKDSIEDGLRKIRRSHIRSARFFPHRYFMRHNYPVIVTQNVFRSFMRFKLFERKPEQLYLLKHGRILRGSDCRCCGRPVDIDEVKSNFTMHFSCVRKMYISRTSDIVTDERIFKNANLIDYVCGVLPTAKLILKKGKIPTTSAEALAEYNDNFPNDRDLGWLNSFYNKYCDLPVEALGKIDPQSLFKDSYFFIRKRIDEINSYL